MEENLEEGEIPDVSNELEDVKEEAVSLENMEEAYETADTGNPTDIDFADSSLAFSYIPPWNWFNPNCFDILYQSTNKTLLVYGARSFIALIKIDNNDHNIQYFDMINVFYLRPKDNTDPYRNIMNFITTVVFEKPKLKNNSSSVRLFVGSSEGIAGVFDLHQRKTLVQMIPFDKFKKPCCKMTNQRKVSSAAWLHFNTGSTVFYTNNINIIRWDVDNDHVQVLHSPQCSQSKQAVVCLSSQTNYSLSHLAAG